MGINHTPGPWIVYGAPGNVWAPFDQKNVANAYIADRDRETQSANARLIAEAPAMLAALRGIMDGGSWQDDGSFVYYPPTDCPDDDGSIGECGAILSRIDGTPTAQPAAPSGEAARPTYAELAHAARDAAEWFASGGEVGGCLLGDNEMAARFSGLVAAMGGEC